MRDYAVSIYSDVETWEQEEVKRKNKQTAPVAEYAEFKRKYIQYLEKLQLADRDWTKAREFKKLLHFINKNGSIRHHGLNTE